MVNFRWTGYNALILLAAMQAVPRDLYESAAIDGAGAARRFFSITIPSIRPTLIFVIITSTIGGLQIFAEPRLFDESNAGGIGGADRQFQTTVLFLWELAFFRRDFGEAAAVAWLLFLIIVAVGLINFLDLAAHRHRRTHAEPSRRDAPQRTRLQRRARDEHPAIPEPIPPTQVDRTVEERRRPPASAAGAADARTRHGRHRQPARLPHLRPARRVRHRQRLPALVVVRRRAAARTRRVARRCPLLPGGNFLANAAKVLDAIPFWLALGNSIIVSAIITISVVIVLDARRLRVREAALPRPRRPAGLRHRDAWRSRRSSASSRSSC